MSDGFTKLFGSLIHSTIWREKDHVRLVWITMLAMVNRHGVVEASLPGVADAARVTIAECEEAIAKLSSPDHYSRSKAHEGRRIATVDGGWRLLNYETYRHRMSIEEQREKAAERQKRFRDNHPERSRTKSERPAPNGSERPFEDSDGADAERTFEDSAGDGPERIAERNGRVTPRNGSNDKAEADREADPDPDQDPAIVDQPDGQRAKRNAAARLVFDAWVKGTGRKKAVFDKKRQSRILARLREGFTAEQLCAAIANRVNDPFLMGANDRCQIYDGIETLLRDAAQVERLVALAAPPRSGTHRVGVPQPRQPSRGYDPTKHAEKL